MLPPYRVEGPGGAPFLVLSNSLGTSSAMWDAQVPALAQRFRVVRYEQRGHGGTPAPAPGPYSLADLGGDVVDLLDHLGAESAHLCGVSLGGMVAMWLAAHHPGRVGGLVLACTAPRLPPPGQWAERARAVRDGGTAGLVGPSLGRWFTPGFLESHPELASAVAGMLAEADPEGYAGCCEAIGAMDLGEELGRIRAPTLVLAGAEDPVCPPPVALALQQSIARSALAVLAGASHLANIEQPDRFGAAVAEHLAGPALQQGRRARRQVLGDAHVDRSEARATPFMAPFLDLITRYAWGEIWTRPGLDRPTRSCITLAMLVALGRFDELPLHVRGALRNGLSEDQIGEVLLQSAIYCGVPAANSAFAVARRVLEEGDDG